MGKVLTIVGAVIAFVLMLMYFGFRGEVVQVLPGQVGRVKTPSGFEEKLKAPGIFRLPANWFGRNPTKLVVADVSDNLVTEPIDDLFMPQDRLKLNFEVVGTFAVRSDAEAKDAIFDRVTPQKTPNAFIVRISFAALYEVYGNQVVRTVSREVVAGNTIEYVFDNLETVSAEIKRRVDERLTNTPLRCRNIGLGEVTPPTLIIDAEEKAKKREIERQTAEAEKEVQLTRADARLQVELLQQQIELVEAETQVLSDLILSDAVSEAFIAQRALRAWEGLANNPNATFVLSTSVFQDPKSLIGLSEERAGKLTIDEETQSRLEEVLKQIEAAKAAELEKMRQEAEQRSADEGGKQEGGK